MPATPNLTVSVFCHQVIANSVLNAGELDTAVAALIDASRAVDEVGDDGGDGDQPE
ncbi:hypothetical protein HanHA89_Chr09g0363981 [Helianthus annuus]|nr:hypothetical protein HanHA89_Chr09g0363981 [Helianthus annuus]